MAILIYGCRKEIVKDIPHDTEIAKENIERQIKNDSTIQLNKVKK
jgi:hypothetical protein